MSNNSNKRRFRGLLALVALAVALAMPTGASAATWPNSNTELQSVTGSTIGNGRSAVPSISGSGRYTVFFSVATNLDPTNAPIGGIFRRNTETGALELVAKRETISNRQCGAGNRPSISEDGRYVAFDTAQGLVANDNNAARDVYVRDMTKSINAADAFTLVSARNGTTVPAAYSGGSCEYGSNLPQSTNAISDDGRKVVFMTTSGSNLPSAGTTDTARANLFVRDLDTNETRLVTSTIDTDESDAGEPIPEPPTGPLFYPRASISGDGSAVVWAGTYARILTEFQASEEIDDGRDNQLFYMWKRIADGVNAPARRITGSVDLDDPACDVNDATLDLELGTPGPCFGPLVIREHVFQPCGVSPLAPAISDDGRFIAYQSCAQKRGSASAFLPGFDVFTTDMTDGVTRKAANREVTDATQAGLDGNETLGSPAVLGIALSGDGETLAMVTNRANFTLAKPLKEGDFPTTVTHQRLFVVENVRTTDPDDDRLKWIAKSTTDGDLNGPLDSVIGVDDTGGRIVFSSNSSNHIAGDANGRRDVFTISTDTFQLPEEPVDPGPGPQPQPQPQPQPTPTLDPVTLSKAIAGKNGVATLQLKFPGAGSVAVAATAKLPKGKKLKVQSAGKATGSATAAGIVSVKLNLSSAAKKYLKKKGKLVVNVKITYTPTFGVASTTTSKVTFKAPKKK